LLNINARLRFWDSYIQWVVLLTKKVGAVEIRRGDSMIKTANIFTACCLYHNASKHNH